MSPSISGVVADVVVDSGERRFRGKRPLEEVGSRWRREECLRLLADACLVAGGMVS